jgi:hypothetical protein
MKIRLNFFDKAYTKVMDVPEGTGTVFRMALWKTR